MSNTIIIGAGVRVEIGITEGAAKTISNITKASPASVTSENHGLAHNSVGYFDTIVGMEQLEGQASVVSTQGSPGDDDFSATDIDTSEFGDFVSGNFIPVTAWATLLQSTTHNIGGGAGQTEEIGCLIDTTQKLRTIKNAAETVTIDVRALKDDNAAMAKIRQTARRLGYLVFRVTHPPEGNETVGARRIYRGQPSIPGESVSQGGTGTGQLTVTIQGQICYIPAA